MKRTLVYNFINAIQIFLGFIFQLLLAKYFGASLFTDIYIISILIVDFISKIGASFTEMFIQYYNDLKIYNNNQEKVFYQCVFNFSILVGILTFTIVTIFMNSIIKLFVSGFDEERTMILKSFFVVLSFSIIWNRLKEINNLLLNAEMRFIIPYVVNILTPISNVTSLLFFSRYYGIYSIAISTLLADMIILSIQHVYILKTFNIGFGMVLWHYKFAEMIRNSLSLKIGNQLWDFKDMVITNILSSFPQGTISLYFYSFRVITVIFMLTNLPSLQIFFSIISRLASEKDFSGMKILLRKTLMRSMIPFLVILTPFSILLPRIFLLFLRYKFSIEDINTIHYIFLALIPFYMTLSVELPFINTIVAMKLSFKVIKVNAIFIIVFCVCAFLLKNAFGIYTIPVALAIAQSQNLIFYIIYVQKFFKETLK